MGRKQNFWVSVIVVFIVMGMLFPGKAFAHKSMDPLVSAMAKYLECYSLELFSFKNQQPLSVPRNLCLLEIYHKNGLSPLWVSSIGPSKSAVKILETLKNSDTDGLSPTDYGIHEMTALWDSLEPEKLARLDTLITVNLIKYVHDISRGHIKLRDIDPLLFAESGDADFDPLATIDTVLTADDLALFFAELPPDHTHYSDLKKSLKMYRDLAERGGWGQIPPGKIIRPGDRDDRMTAIIKRLTLTGDLMAPVDDDSRYGSSLIPSIKQFQTRHGLNPDGEVGPKTRAAMNIPVQTVVRKIMINMARWRWQAHYLGQKYILVNIASFNLRGFDQGDMKINFPVIVGKLQSQTPVFSDRVQYVTFNPFWNIPTNIAKDEVLLELRKDPLYLVKQHIRLFSSWQKDAVELDSTTMDWAAISEYQISLFKLRQDPGPWNALGDVKFIFPNGYDVYMHATIHPHLFQRRQRDFSHGCIRVSDPLGLAEFILSHGEVSWERGEIGDIIQQGERKVVIAKRPVPVHITYQTTWMGGDGLIYFSRDIYGRDEKLGQALFPGDVIH